MTAAVFHLHSCVTGEENQTLATTVRMTEKKRRGREVSIERRRGNNWQWLSEEALVPLLKRRWETISIKGRQFQSLFQRVSTVVPLQRATTQVELREVLIRSFFFSNTVTGNSSAPQSRVFASQPTGKINQVCCLLIELISGNTLCIIICKIICSFLWIDTIGDNYPPTIDAHLVISVMSMWTRMQPAYVANMWNEALNMRLGTEIIDKIRIQNSGYI
ncbi:hypothetical protein LXL04_008497 [Taraxacum kok-saghyz]